MRSFLTLVFVLALAVQINAQDSGIDFVSTDWQTTLADAKAADKIIFVDAYTTWCGPCKWMAKNVFTDPEVAEFYNKKFINIKLDMEKGEGVDFANEYKVQAYPTLLYIDGEGNMVHRTVGARASDDFIDVGEVALDPDRNIGGLTAEYEEGNRDEEFLRKYAEALQMARVPGADKIAMDYLATQDDWSSEENMKFVFQMMPYTMDSKLSQYVSDNREAYYELIGEEDVDQQLKNAISSDLRKSGDVSLEKMQESLRKHFGEKGDKMAKFAAVQYYMNKNDEANVANFEDALLAYAKQYRLDGWQQLNSVAWHIYEVSDNPNLWKLGKEWAIQSVQLDSNYFNNDTVAALCYKLGEKDQAMKYAKKAIEHAKESGRDYEETKELIKKIKEMEE